MRISSLALASHTAKVPLIYVSPKDQLLGKTTKEAVETGLYRGYIYLINGFIESYRQRYPTVTVIGAGRGLSVLREQLAIDDFVEDLVLDGLLWCLKSLKIEEKNETV